MLLNPANSGFGYHHLTIVCLSNLQGRLLCFASFYISHSFIFPHSFNSVSIVLVLRPKIKDMNSSLQGIRLGVVIITFSNAELPDGAQLSDGLSMLGLHLALIKERANFGEATTANHTQVKVLGVLG